MRFHPALTPLCLAIALMAGGLGTHGMASNHDESSPDEAHGSPQDGTREGSQALDDDVLQEKYGITPGALKRDESGPEAATGDDGQAQSDDGQLQDNGGQASKQDNAKEAEQDGLEEQEGDAGDVITDVTEVEEGDEGVDNTEKEMPTN